MANKRPKPEEIVSKLRQVEVLMGQAERPNINNVSPGPSTVGCDEAIGASLRGSWWVWLPNTANRRPS
ncbi:hypothetical protein [Ruegeria lacuscaerulensis]|uniref:hypothetical protein n=1 Tax=Ruegeria lacuscaerulensis TaxID=55218 RepID=UPI00147F3AD7|nr:hypothetical protein [Ruegeria lacuscaerulensis]